MIFTFDFVFVLPPSKTITRIRINTIQLNVFNFRNVLEAFLMFLTT